MKKLLVFFVLFFLISGALFAQVRAGRQAWVSVKQAPVKVSTWFFAGTRGNLAVGAEVSVLQINGDWAEIRADTMTGWTRLGNLSHRQIVGEGSSATAREVALAGKGFDREVEGAYKASGNLNYDGVDWMEGQTVSQGALFEFMEEGRLITGGPQ